MHHLPSRYIPCDGRLTASTYFNPHSPHRERLAFSNSCSRYALFQSTLPAGGATTAEATRIKKIRFQSTLPAWGATGKYRDGCCIRWISIHAPRRRSDSFVGVIMILPRYFNPRSPQGERPSPRPITCSASYFNPRSPQGERLLPPMMMYSAIKFQSTLPAGGATET